jgi:hypothetical protein
MTIWKYELRLNPGTMLVEMPCGARVLSVDMQHGAPVLWALVQSDAAVTPRKLTLCYTGVECSDDVLGAAFVGTVQTSHGLVLHVFDHGYEVL